MATETEVLKDEKSQKIVSLVEDYFLKHREFDSMKEAFQYIDKGRTSCIWSDRLLVSIYQTAQGD
jgi:hypothetical protein